MFCVPLNGFDFDTLLTNAGIMIFSFPFSALVVKYSISFVMDFQKVEFPEACKMLGADIAATPSETIRRNINRVVSRLPSYDKRNAELCAKLLENAEILESNYNSYYSIDGNFYQSVIDEDMNIVNLYNLVDGSFVAGGVSHLAVTRFLLTLKT